MSITNNTQIQELEDQLYAKEREQAFVDGDYAPDFVDLDGRKFSITETNNEDEETAYVELDQDEVFDYIADELSIFDEDQKQELFYFLEDLITCQFPLKSFRFGSGDTIYGKLSLLKDQIKNEKNLRREFFDWLSFNKEVV